MRTDFELLIAAELLFELVVFAKESETEFYIFYSF